MDGIDRVRKGFDLKVITPTEVAKEAKVSPNSVLSLSKGKRTTIEPVKEAIIAAFDRLILTKFTNLKSVMKEDTNG